VAEPVTDPLLLGQRVVAILETGRRTGSWSCTARRCGIFTDVFRAWLRTSVFMSPRPAVHA